MPRSLFLGRPVPAPGEPLWLEDDRSWALALLELEADVCPSCGHPTSESHDPGAEGAYVAEAVRCWACYAAETRAAEWSEAAEERRHTAGVRFQTRRRA